MKEGLESFAGNEVVLELDGGEKLFSFVDFLLDFVFQNLNKFVTFLFDFHVGVIVDSYLFGNLVSFLHFSHLLLTSDFPFLKFLVQNVKVLW